MKNLFKLVLCSTFLAGTFFSCKKDENKISFEGGTVPVLVANKTSIALGYIDKDKEAVTFSWNNPNYKFTTGLSSQDVTYLLEIDTTGANFTNPKKKQVSIVNDLTKTITQNDFNDYLLSQLELAPDIPHNLDIRLTASIGGSTATEVISNLLNYSVTPYSIPPKVTPPASGELYITGSAVPSSWTNSPPMAQKFTKISATFYTITIPIIGGNSYTFLPTYGSWNDKYSIAVKNDPTQVNGGDFQWQGNDILAPAASGNYKIDVDFQIGKFKVTKL